ncbi:cytochrome-c peroxidase, partial [Xanthomonas perforans]|nr:cytochrome-c peroxidase [Xanthomonas perforans]
RNVATTAPYFHDGSATTLPQAIKAMGTAQLGVTLSPADVADIAAFLQTLTGKHQGRQLTAPAP